MFRSRIQANETKAWYAPCPSLEMDALYKSCQEGQSGPTPLEASNGRRKRLSFCQVFFLEIMLLLGKLL